MYPFLLQIHAITRYAVLGLLVFVIVKSIYGIVRKDSFSKFDRLYSILLSSVSHIQLITGLILYFISPFVVFSNEMMTNAINRYWAIEHILMMVIAIALITLGGILSKTEQDNIKKYRKLLFYNLGALLLIVATIYLSGRGIL